MSGVAPPPDAAGDAPGGEGEFRRLLHLLRWRRDVRHFRADPVPEAMLARLAHAMALAPSVGNARPWRVMRVRDAALRAAVRAEFEACNAEAAAGYAGARADAYGRLKLAGLDRAPEQLAVFTVADPSQGHGLGRRTMPATLGQSTAMAIHTLWLAARTLGLGVGMVSILRPERIERLLDAPPGWAFAAWLCLGWPEAEHDTPLLHREGWQENAEAVWIER